MTDELRVECAGPLGFLTVNRPERRNALTLALWQRIPEVIARLDSEPGVRVIVIRGAGNKAFVSGADITEFKKVRGDPQSAAAYAAATERAFTSLRKAHRPVMAWIQGACFGGGLALALSADLRIAADGSRFSIPAARLGLAYGQFGVARLVDTVGAQVARRLLYTGEIFEASRAVELGVVDEVAAPEVFEARAEAWAEALAASAPLAVSYAKRAIEAHLGCEAVELADAAARACFESEDYAEGTQAFLEKRSPKFRGC